MDVRAELEALGVVRRGEFLLRSGDKTDVYADFRAVFKSPKVLATLAHRLSKLIDKDLFTNHNSFAVAGVPLGGVPYATLVAHILQKPLILVRDKPKAHGAKDEKSEPMDVLLLEDVVTAGTSVLQATKTLEAQGHRVRQVVCILDRRPAPFMPIFRPDANHGIPIASIFTCKYKEEKSKEMKLGGKRGLLEFASWRSKSRLIASIDVPDGAEFTKILGKVAPYVCAVKLHLDLLRFQSEAEKAKVYALIAELKEKFGFLVIEDRKFADIGSICLLQANLLPPFVDMVTCHGIAGPGALLELDKTGMGLLPVYQMSTENNLIDPIYSAKLADAMLRCKNIVGVISQERVPGYLTLCPGINLDQKLDHAGQTYRAPTLAIADFFIVGRGLCNADNVEAAAERYRVAIESTAHPAPPPALPAKL